MSEEKSLYLCGECGHTRDPFGLAQSACSECGAVSWTWINKKALEKLRAHFVAEHRAGLGGDGKHTRAPWNAELTCVVNAARGLESYHNGEAWKDKKGDFGERVEANRLLIGQAPEMAAEIQRLRKEKAELLAALKFFAENAEVCHKHEPGDVCVACMLERIIAKAEGASDGQE